MNFMLGFCAIVHSYFKLPISIWTCPPPLPSPRTVVRAKFRAWDTWMNIVFGRGLFYHVLLAAVSQELEIVS